MSSAPLGTRTDSPAPAIFHAIPLFGVLTLRGSVELISAVPAGHVQISEFGVLGADRAEPARTVAAARQRAAAAFILDIGERFYLISPAMKIKTVLALRRSSARLRLIAQSSNLHAAEAAKHVGETATITGTVDGVHQSGKGNIFLNMGGKYPNQAFTALSLLASAAQFPILSSTKDERWPCRKESLCTRANRKSSSTRLRRSAYSDDDQTTCIALGFAARVIGTGLGRVHIRLQRQVRFRRWNHAS